MGYQLNLHIKMANLENLFEIIKDYGFKKDGIGITNDKYVIEASNDMFLTYHKSHGFIGFSEDIQTILNFLNIKTK